jgi:hypothetical protein
MLQQELTAYLNLSEESPIFLKFMEGLKLNKSIPTNDFLVSINQPNKENLKKVGDLQRFFFVDISCFAPLWISSTICIWLYCTIISDVKSLDGPSGPEKILQIYMPGLKFIYQVGWIDLIPLLAFASEGHIPLCCTPHYESAAPVTGATEKCEVSFDFE